MKRRALRSNNVAERVTIKCLGNNLYQASAICSCCGLRICTTGMGEKAAKKFLWEEIREHVQRCPKVKELKEDMLLVNCK
jgi:hypothetical protein